MTAKRLSGWGSAFLRLSSLWRQHLKLAALAESTKRGNWSCLAPHTSWPMRSLPGRSSSLTWSMALRSGRIHFDLWQYFNGRQPSTSSGVQGSRIPLAAVATLHAPAVLGAFGRDWVVGWAQ